MTRTLFGYAIEGDVDLTRARPGPNGRGRLTIRRTDEELLSRTGELVSWDETEGTQFALATAGGDLLAWCSITGSYLVCGPQAEIVARPSGAHEHWEHRLGSTIVPLALAERGDLALHASALAEEGRAVLFCGPPGRGKSTAAAALTLRGLELISEDGVVISDPGSEALAWPGQTGVRIPAGVLGALQGDGHELSSDRIKTTQLIAEAQRTDPASVGAVILLAPVDGTRPELQRLDPVGALPALMPYALYGGPSRLPEALERSAALAGRVPVFRGRLPRNLKRAGEHAHALAELALSGR